MHCKTSKVTIITLLTYYKISLTNTWVSYHCGLMLGDHSCYVPDVQPAEVQKGDAITRDTNSTIENYFCNLKSILQAKQRYRVTNFIRNHYTRISGRLNEARTYKPKHTEKNHKKNKRYFRY